MKIKKIAVFLLISSIIVTSVPAKGETNRERLESVQAEKAYTESSIAQAEEKISALESLKGDREAYLTELNTQYEELTASLKKLTKKAKKKDKELAQVKADLKAAKRQEAAQYEAMKMRIAYMYENGESSMLAMLLSAESFTDFLNRAENVAMINKYDRDMLEEYRATQKEVRQKKNAVEEEQKEIERLKEESTGKREEIARLEEATQGEISLYQEEISDKQTEVSCLLNLVNEQASQLESLVAKVEAEEAAARAAEEAAKQRAEEEAARAAEAAETAQDSDASSADYDTEDDEAARDSDDSEAYEEPQEENYDSSQDSDSSSETQSAASASGGTYLGNFKLTAYCNCAKCCGTAGNYTASGTWPTPGRTVAMAGVPFGTQLLINGAVYTVEDLGTPYGHVDIYMGSHSEALSFGLQYADVYQLN